VTDRLTPPVLLVGVGNDLRGDDAAGLVVARAAEAWGRPGVRVLERRQLTPELVPDVAAAATVVLVDAAVGVSGLRFDPVAPAEEGGRGLSHGYALPELLALARRLEGSAPAAWQVAIPAEEFGVGAAPSARCRDWIADALRMLAGRLPR
jgi:hydrogenase maturation protease